MNRAMGWWVVLGLAAGCAATKSGQQQPAARAGASEQAMEVVPLQFASADTVAEELRKLGSEGEVEVDPRTNSLILQGSPGWIAKAMQRIAELDKAQESVEVVPLKHATAVELASTLNELLEASRRAVSNRGCALPRPGTEVQMPRGHSEPVAPDFQVVADAHTNSLVVSYSNADDLPRLLELIGRLDADAQH
jgi:type II secretory pathway component GspD/PulD (secretin)